MKSYLIVQTGDYGEAYQRFAEGGAETYRDQKASVDYFADMAPAARVTTLAFVDHEERVELAPNLWSICTDTWNWDVARAKALMQELACTHVVLRTPHQPVLEAAAQLGLPVLPLLADTFAASGNVLRRMRTGQQFRKFAATLRKAQVPCVSNHGLSASRSVRDTLGFPAEQVVPWDFPALQMWDPAKAAPASDGPVNLLFAGALIAGKGVGDVLDALALLRSTGLDARLHIIGSTDAAEWQAKAAALALGEACTFEGLVPNTVLRERMRVADIMLVPSRLDYAEGFPSTIMEALAARTPVIVSDHPAFAARLPADMAPRFAPSDPKNLAARVTELLANPKHYADISARAHEVVQAAIEGVTWSDLITLFLNDPENRTNWVRSHALDTYPN